MSSSWHLNPPQLDDFCRVCLLRKRKLRPLVTQFSGVMVPEMLYKVTGTMLNMQEQLPRVICDRCLVKLELAYNIAEEFRMQEEKLRRFWWKGGVLVDELVQYQQSEESWRKTHSEEVIERLTSERLAPVAFGTVKAATTTELKGERDSGFEMTNVMVEPVQTQQPLVKSEPFDASSFCIEILSDDSADAADQEPTLQNVIDNELEMALKLEDPGTTGVLPVEADELLVEQREFPEQQQQPEVDSFGADAPPSPVESGSEQNDNDKDSDYEPDGIKVQQVRRRKPPVASGSEQGVFEDSDGDSSDCGIPPIQKGDTTCPVCGHEYKTFMSLKRHHRRHVLVAKQRYKCKKCSWIGASLAELKTHKLSHLNNTFKCKYCSKCFQFRKCLQAHHLEHASRNDPMLEPNHNDSSKKKKRLLECRFCEKVFHWVCRLKQHEEIHMKKLGKKANKQRDGDNTDLVCEFCPKTCRDPRELMRHLKTHDEFDPLAGDDKRRLKCPKCDRSYPEQISLDAHLKRHEIVESGMYKCKHCDQAFGSRAELTRHLRRHDNKAMENVASPIIIRRNGATYFKCRDCSKVFVSKHTHLNHVRTQHDVAKPEAFQCPDCGKMFGQRANLRLHQNEVHSLFIKAETEEQQQQQQQKPQESAAVAAAEVLHCNECDTLFSSLESYEIHLQGHRSDAAAVAFEGGPPQESTDQVSDQPSDLPIIQDVAGSFVKNEAPSQERHIVQQNLPIAESHQKPQPEEVIDTMDTDQQAPAPSFVDNSESVPEWQDQASASGSDYANLQFMDEQPDRSQATPSVGSESLDATGYSIELLSDDSDDDDVIALAEDKPDSRPSTSGGEFTPGDAKSKSWSCTICDFVITTTTEAPIKRHMVWHQNMLNGIYKCEVCQKKFGLNTELQKHRRLIHNLKQPSMEDFVECEKCFKQIKRNKFSFHVQTHKNLEMRCIVCKVCDKAFGTKHHLVWHYKSKSCQKSHELLQQRSPIASAAPVLIQRGNTLQMVGQRQQEGRYKCTECNKSFANSQTIYAHMQKHHASKADGRFTCNVCNLACPTQLDLDVHMRLHPESAQQGDADPATN